MAMLIDQRHELFCQLCVSGKTNAEAYAEAGFECSTNASSFRRKPHIERRIKELTDRAANKACITKARIIEEAAAMAFYNPADFMGDTSELDREQALAITEITTTVDAKGKTTRRLKLADKAKALELVAKLTGNLVERTEKGMPGEFNSIAGTEELIQAVREQLGDSEAIQLSKLIGHNPDKPQA